VSAQLDFFGSPSSMPAGFKYRPDLLSPADQERLLPMLEALPFRAFEFKGFVGNRRTVSFGWRYDFAAEELRRGDDIPSFLDEIRRRAAEFAEVPATELEQAMVTEYAPGAGIGWHKDKAIFGDVVGISLLSPCTFRFRRRKGSSWERASFTAAPGSAYLLRGPARTDWQHSIPPLEKLRYSITLRSLRGRVEPAARTKA
jgi:alkylated DNA repair dioxygenase AlkB